jgi:hypothetical protein
MNRFSSSALLAAAIMQAASFSFAAENKKKPDATEELRLSQTETVIRSAQVQLRAEVDWIRSEKDGSYDIVFHVSEVYDMSPDKVDKLSPYYLLKWKERNRPIPLIEGQEVKLGIKGDEILHIDMGVVAPILFRYAPKGQIELLVSDQQRWTLVRPHQIESLNERGIEMQWVKGFGIVMTNYGTSDKGLEMQDLSSQEEEIVPSNARDQTIKIGRDGWRSIKSAQAQASKESRAKLYRKLVPSAQRIGSDR